MNADPDTAFMDLASNLLAVVMIVTLFSLLSLQSASREFDDPRPQERDPTVDFRTPQRWLFPPLAAFYLVLEDQVRPWAADPIIAQLRDDPRRYNGRVPGGRYNWQGDERGSRDVDVYRLSFWPDPQAMIPNLDDTALLQQLTEEYQHRRRAPVFVVYPSGMDAFARLYPQLEASTLPFRWFTRPEGEPLTVGRTPNQFLDHGIYW